MVAAAATTAVHHGRLDLAGDRRSSSVVSDACKWPRSRVLIYQVICTLKTM
jgi:hypothetical protein